MRINETESVDVWTALKYLERLEAKLADIYELMCKTYGHDKEADQLFSWLTRKEKSHVKMINLELRLIAAERGCFENVKMDIYGIKKSISMAENLYDSIKEMTLSEAVEGLLELAQYSCDKCFRDTIIMANPALEKMMSRMNVTDQGSSDAITKFAEKRGYV